LASSFFIPSFLRYSSQVTKLWKKMLSPSSMPRVISVMWDVEAPNAPTAKMTAFSGSILFPHV
jgi:hypothetical protein